MTYARRTLVLAALAGLSVLTVGAGPAMASRCGDQIIDDWFKDGRIDKTYALHCYDDALEQLPNDVETYSDAPQVIKRALTQALKQGAPVETNGSSGDDPTETTGGGGSGGSGDGPDTTTSTPTETTPTETTPDSPGTPDPGQEEALGSETSSNASSVPLPLIVLAGLALLLLAAGGAGYLNRRLQARRIDGGRPGPNDPPADL